MKSTIRKFTTLVHRLYDWVLGWAEHKWAVPALCGISFTEASFFLIPPDVLLIALGTSRPKRALVYAFWTTVFSVLGALFGYWIGLTLWESVKDYFFNYIFTQEQFNLVKTYFMENTFTAIVIAAFTPIPFKAFTVIGGVLSAPLLPFIAGAAVGRSARYFLLGGLFYIFGEKIRTYIDRHFEKATLAIGALAILGAIVYYIVRNYG